MSARRPADVIATALVASYRFGGKDPRELLGPQPSVTLLADAALVIASHFGVRNSKAARLCCLGRPQNLVAQKMALTFACAKRDRRQAAIKAALAAMPPVPKPQFMIHEVPPRQFGKSEAARSARQKSSAPSPIDLPPIPPAVCGTKWTRDYIAERERIKALHRAAGRKVPQ
jgi:hypothetical protein